MLLKTRHYAPIMLGYAPYKSTYKMESSYKSTYKWVLRNVSYRGADKRTTVHIVQYIALYSSDLANNTLNM